MNRYSVAALVAVWALGAAGVQAANFSKQEYDSAREEVKATFKQERRACERLSGHAREVCSERAKGAERVALAQLRLEYTGTAEDEIALYRAEYEARHKVAKKRCAELKGSERDICMQQAKTERDKAEADARMARRINEAVAEDTRARLKADYALAREKCDALSGDAKDACLASAKARYSEGW